jgi:hypothetical protein
MKRVLLTACLFVLAQPAFAQSVVETDFTISVPNGTGENVVESTTLVPLLDDTCFTWWIRLAKTKGPVDVTEIYTLPAAPETWGLGEGSTAVISEDRRVATSTYSLTPDDGWIGEDWCIAPGDPVGPYSFEILRDGELLHRFDFEVQEM